MTDVEAIDRDLLALLQRGCEHPTDDTWFNDLAQRLFVYQFAANIPYQKYCQRRGQTPDTVQHWRDIPAVPIGAFKELTLSCIPPEQRLVDRRKTFSINNEARSIVQAVRGLNIFRTLSPEFFYLSCSSSRGSAAKTVVGRQRRPGWRHAAEPRDELS